MKTLADARLDKGITQKMLAETVNMSTVQISILENRKAKPLNSTRRKIEAALQTKIDWEK